MWLLVAMACTSGTDPVGTCPPPPPEAGAVRVRQLACAADLPTGAGVAARVGDWVLENAVSRFVVRDGPEGHALVGLTGGNLVDAVRWVDGAQIGGDALRELVATAGFHQVAPTRLLPLSDGLQVSGPWTDLPTIHEVFPVAQPRGLGGHTYRLLPDVPVLELVTTIDGDVGPADSVLPTGAVQLWLPGGDPWDLPVAVAAPEVALSPWEPGAVPAVALGGDPAGQLLTVGALRAMLYEPGTVLRRVALGVDTAEALDHLAAARGEVRAEVALVGDRQVALDEAGRPLARCHRDPCAEPPGAISWEPTWLGDGNGGPGGPGQRGAPAELTVRVSDAGPVRVDLHRTVDGGTERRTGVDADGEATFLVPPDTYDVWLSRGPLHAIHAATVDLTEGAATIEATLPRVVDPGDWWAVDLHLHAEGSPDSDDGVDLRLLDAAAQGLDAVVRTDHDFVSAPPAAPPGLLVVPGAEVSTMTLGHYNHFPATLDPDRAGQGAPDWHGLDGPALQDLLQDGVVQCNHPRFVDGGYAAAFDVPEIDRTRCDLVEVLNAFTLDDTDEVLQDWFALLDAGTGAVATGTSDTHELRDAVGHGRTWVRSDTAPTADTLPDLLRSGRAIASLGPLLELALSEGGGSATIGQTLAATGPVTAVATMLVPDWMPLGEVTLWADGVAVYSEDVSATAAAAGVRAVRVEAEVDAARWVVATHQGAAAFDPVLRRSPRAVTNPVWVDRQ